MCEACVYFQFSALILVYYEPQGVGPQVSHPEASDLWGNKQYGGEYLATVPHSGGHSVSQIVPIGHSISAEPLALERTMQEIWAEEQLWDEPALEVSGRC